MLFHGAGNPGTFGTPVEAGPGFLRLLDDNAVTEGNPVTFDHGTGANLYFIASDGTNWWHFTATKAV